MSYDFDYVACRIESEGFDYCFDGYSNWKEIDDVEFHRLRLEYIKIKRELEAYVISRVNHEN